MNKKHCQNIAFVLFTVSVLGLFNLFIFSFRPMGMGIWPQSETAIAALHGFSSLSTFGLIFLFMARPRLIRILAHPLIVLPLLIGLISLVFTPFHRLPLVNILGSTRLGEGVAWWFNWASISASFLILCRLKRARVLLLSLSVLSTLMLYVMAVGNYHFGFKYSPYNFPDFLAFHLLALIPVAYYWGRRLNPWILWPVIYIALNALMYWTNNFAGILYGFVGTLFFLALWFGPRIISRYKTRLSHVAIMAIPPLMVIFFIVLGLWPFEHGYYTIHGSSVAIQNITARAYLMQSVLMPFWHNPLLGLIGSGWGTFADLLIYNLPTRWLDFTNEFYGQWGGLIMDHFHSHNAYIEAFYAAGLIPALLLYAYTSFLALRASRNYKLPALIFSGGIVSLLSFWFILPLTLPCLLLSAALISKRSDLFFINYLPKTRFIWLGLAMIALVQTAAGFITLATAYSADNYEPKVLEVSDIKTKCTADIQDFGAGGLHLSKLLRGRTGYIAGLQVDLEDKRNDRLTKDMKEEKVLRLENQIALEYKRLNHIFCQSTLYVQNHRPSTRLEIARLLTRGELLLGMASYMDDQTRDYYYSGWREDLIKWLKRYPSRTDQAVPYLNWHVIYGKDKEVAEIADLIYAQTPQDPVGLWHKGLGLLAMPHGPEGISMMREALDRGLERYMPVDESLKEKLK